MILPETARGLRVVQLQRRLEERAEAAGRGADHRKHLHRRRRGYGGDQHRDRGGNRGREIASAGMIAPANAVEEANAGRGVRVRRARAVDRLRRRGVERRVRGLIDDVLVGVGHALPGDAVAGADRGRGRAAEQRHARRVADRRRGDGDRRRGARSAGRRGERRRDGGAAGGQRRHLDRRGVAARRDRHRGGHGGHRRDSTTTA